MPADIAREAGCDVRLLGDALEGEARAVAQAQAQVQMQPLPLATAAHQLYLDTAAAGHGREDDSAVIKLYATLGGIELPPAAGSRAPGI